MRIIQSSFFAFTRPHASTPPHPHSLAGFRPLCQIRIRSIALVHSSQFSFDRPLQFTLPRPHSLAAPRSLHLHRIRSTDVVHSPAPRIRSIFFVHCTNFAFTRVESFTRTVSHSLPRACSLLVLRIRSIVFVHAATIAFTSWIRSLFYHRIRSRSVAHSAASSSSSSSTESTTPPITANPPTSPTVARASSTVSIFGAFTQIFPPCSYPSFAA